MSWNPLVWIRDALVSDYVGSAIRHTLTAFGLLLVTRGLTDAQHAHTWIEATMQVIQDPHFIPGIIAMFTGGAAAVENKK